MNKKTNFISALCISACLSLPAMAGGHGKDVYQDFPVTLQGYDGDKKTSVSYTGQIARHLLHDSLKVLAGQGNGNANPALKAQMLEYYDGNKNGHDILSAKSFKFKQSRIEEVSKGKNLSGKTYKGTVVGIPNNMTGTELVKFWIDKASLAKSGVDMTNGYNYPQLISKFIMGAVSYHQAVDNYLDEKMTADNKPNDKPYKKGAYYTGKEHSWDEAFGYFGTPAHTLHLKPAEIYNIAKQKKDAMSVADHNKDGVIDFKTEMVFGPAYYAGGSDKSGKTEYSKTITDAFIHGRQLIADAKGKKLTDAQRKKLMDYANVITKNWEAILAEAAFKYAGSVYKDLGKLKENPSDTKLLKNYIKHWGELKGFVLSLETGKSNNSVLSRELTDLIGYGPVMPNGEQVTTITSNGQYIRSSGESLDNYRLHMLKAQKLLAKSFPIKAKANDVMGDLAALEKQLGEIEGAETD